MAGHGAQSSIVVSPVSGGFSTDRDMMYQDTCARPEIELGAQIRIGFDYVGLKPPVQVAIFDLGPTSNLTVLAPDGRFLRKGPSVGSRMPVPASP